jgi:hypothetical protein
LIDAIAVQLSRHEQIRREIRSTTDQRAAKDRWHLRVWQNVLLIAKVR